MWTLNMIQHSLFLLDDYKLVIRISIDIGTNSGQFILLPDSDKADRAQPLLQNSCK